MRIWLITVGEPLPLPQNKDRLWRTGLLANVLADRGHEVVWWTSTVDHFTKTYFVPAEACVPVRPGLTLQFLHGSLYKKNISYARLRNHRQLADSFSVRALREAVPQVIVCSFPTIELSVAAVRYGARQGIPVLLDIRDLWPDIFLSVLPAPLHFVGRMLLRGLFDGTREALEAATGLLAVSEGYLQWGLNRAGRPRRGEDQVYPLAYRMSQWERADEDSLLAKLRGAGVVEGVPVVLFSGTFGRTYDLATVIRAARILATQDVRANFIFCGRGDQEQEWRQLAEGVPGVHFLGWLGGSELACLLSKSAIGLAAYAGGAPQGIPNKIVEYLAAGLPVLSSLEGETAALLDERGCGRSYRSGDPVDLSEALKSMLAHANARSRMASASIRVFEESYSADSVYPRMAVQLERLGGATGGERASIEGTSTG